MWTMPARSALNKSRAVAVLLSLRMPARTEMSIGLGSNTTNDTTADEIDFRFQFDTSNNYAVRVSNGAAASTYRIDGFYAVGSTFRVETDGTDVVFKLGTTTVHTEENASISDPLVMDVSFLDVGASITDPDITGGSGGGSRPCTPNIRTDFGTYPEPALPSLPQSGGKFCDPTFGTEIMRVTDNATHGFGHFGTEYAYWPTINSDNTKIHVYDSFNGGSFCLEFNPVTFELIGNRVDMPSGLSSSAVIWSNSNPNKCYAMQGSGGVAAIIEVTQLRHDRNPSYCERLCRRQCKSLRLD